MASKFDIDDHESSLVCRFSLLSLDLTLHKPGADFWSSSVSICFHLGQICYGTPMPKPPKALAHVPSHVESSVGSPLSPNGYYQGFDG